MFQITGNAPAGSHPPRWLNAGNPLDVVRRGATVLALSLASVPMSGLAADQGQSKTAEGLAVYLGVMPAEIVKGHPRQHPEAQAHGGPPSGEHAYHFVVAVFDVASGARIEDAKVTARVSSLGLTGPQRSLDPMKIADTVTYGNYFNLPGRGPYRVEVQIGRPRVTAKVTFDYVH